MSRKFLTTLKLGVAAIAMVVGIGASGITTKAAFDAPYYNINVNGGSFDGTHYVLADGTVVTDAFFCDGTYTYFLQADGTPMKDRLTYHPDGEQIIYFDAQGHECFDTFASVKKNIEGNPVDDLCYFGSTGNLYVNVITYNKEGTAIYYANPYGVMERNGVFELDTNAVNYGILANGCHYGYANSDGTVVGFYATYEEAANRTSNSEGLVDGWWNYYGSVTYDGAGNQISRSYTDGNTDYTYTMRDGQEYLTNTYTSFYDGNGRQYGYESKSYSIKSDGTTYLSSEYKSTYAQGQDRTYYSKSYNQAGELTYSTVDEYAGNVRQKTTYLSVWNNGKSKEEDVTTFNYVDGKLVSAVTNETYTYDGKVSYSKSVDEYDANEFIVKSTRYSIIDGVEEVSGYTEYIYTVIAGKQVIARQNYYYVYGDGEPQLESYYIFGYDENGNQISEEDYYLYGSDGEAELSWAMEQEYIKLANRSYWNTKKRLVYSCYDGVKNPNYGYEYVYDENGRQTQYIYYDGVDGQWVVDYYTVYNVITLPGKGTPDQITTAETSREYDGNNVCTEYTVNYYRFVAE